jgi:hypothetical protein
MNPLRLGVFYASISIAHIVVWYYAISVLFVLVVGILSWFVWDKRVRERHGNAIPKGYERTEEVSIDPRTGEKLRVYYNPDTGERFYHLERD